MKNLKIFYSIDDIFPPYRVDVSELFGVSLAKRGLDTEWYMRNPISGKAASIKLNNQTVHLPGFIKRSGLLWKIINKLAFWFYDALNLWRCRNSAELIQVRDKTIAALIGLLVARIKGIPFVYWYSYPFPEDYLESAKVATGMRRLYFNCHARLERPVLYRFVMPLSDHVFVQSGQMKIDLAVYGVPPDKMTPIPMGIPSQLLSFVGTKAVQEVPGRIVYLGTLAAIRQLQVLIEAFAKVHAHIPNARLVIVGDGDIPEETVSLVRLAQQFGIGFAVDFTGFVPIEQAWKIAASAQVCVSPIYPTPVLNSASPTKLNEYMALGKPVVCNVHPEQSATINASGAGLCVPWGAEHFANAMIWLFEHPDEAREMGAKGADWVAQHRTYDRIAETVWNKYQDIMQTKS
ncbi:MAG: glycosyltransferase [Methyloglobulus sp.]|nr:glycosyltransferase [Methyloglobulus sp.]